MAWVSFFNVLAWLLWTIYKTSVLVLWICLSVLLSSLRNCHLNRKATELKATRDVMQEAVSELQEEIQPGTRKRQVGGGGGASCLAVPVFVYVCAWDRQWAHRQLLTAPPQMSPVAGHEGMEQEGKTGGQTHWMKPHFIALLATEQTVEFCYVSSAVTVGLSETFPLPLKHPGFLWDLLPKEFLDPSYTVLKTRGYQRHEVLWYLYIHGCGLFSALGKGKYACNLELYFFRDYERVKKKHICSTEAERPCGEHSGLCQQFFLPFHIASNGKVLPALCKLLISSCYQIPLIKRQVAPVLTVWGKMNNCWCPLNSV